MVNITLRFLGVGYNNINQAYVFIYDEFGNIIYSGQTYNGEVNVFLACNKLYKIEASFLNYYIKTSFFVRDNFVYTFMFNNTLLDSYNNTTLLLTDYYYDNLSIEKGELILWKK